VRQEGPASHTKGGGATGSRTGEFPDRGGEHSQFASAHPLVGGCGPGSASDAERSTQGSSQVAGHAWRGRGAAQGVRYTEAMEDSTATKGPFLEEVGLGVPAYACAP